MGVSEDTEKEKERERKKDKKSFKCASVRCNGLVVYLGFVKAARKA